MTEMICVKLGRLTAKDNPRGSAHDNTELADSIRLVGLLTPLLVREGDGGWFKVLNGGRRLSALRALRADGAVIPWLDYDEIPCYPASTYKGLDPTDADWTVLKVAANLQRPLPPSKVGKAIAEIMVSERWTLERAGKAIGEAPRRAQLLVHLSYEERDVQRKVDSGKMSLSAYAVFRNSRQEAQEAIMDRETVTVVQARTEARRPVDNGQDTLDVAVPDSVAILSDLKRMRNTLKAHRAHWRDVSSMDTLSAQELFVLEEIHELLQDWFEEGVI